MCSEEIMTRLKHKNIETKSGQTIKDIAEEYAIHPIEIAGMLRDL